MQEDFAYHRELVALVDHPYRSEPKTEVQSILNDGLNRLARHPFEGFVRRRWAECHGSVDAGNDCLADKGFSVATHILDDGVEVVVYNLHADAGDSAGDVAARRAEFAQLTAHASTHARDRALIIAGDTNLDVGELDDGPIFEALLDDLQLQDACRSVRCDRPLIDRVLFRSGAGVAPTVVQWRVADEMVDPNGTPLSDHFAVHAVIEWQKR